MNQPVIVGQPFSLANLSVPVNVTVVCNCAALGTGVGTDIAIVNSAPTHCPVCQKLYTVTWNPIAGQIAVTVGLPGEGVPN